MDLKSNDPLTIDRIKLSEKLQKVSPIERLLIPAEFASLALSFLKKNNSDSTENSQQISDLVTNKTEAETKRESCAGKDEVTPTLIELHPNDLIIPPKSEESIGASLTDASDPSLKVDKECEHIQVVDDIPKAKPVGRSTNPAELEVDDLEEWLDDIL